MRAYIQKNLYSYVYIIKAMLLLIPQKQTRIRKLKNKQTHALKHDPE